MADLVLRLRCIFCHDGLERGDAVHCASCLAPHHRECQATHGRCAAPGCDDTRVLVPDPDGRPARPSEPVDAKAKDAEKGEPTGGANGRARFVLGALAVALALGAFALWPTSRTIAAAPVAPVPPIPPVPPVPPVPPIPPVAPVEPIAPPAGPAPRVVHVGPAASVSLVARDFRLPVRIGSDERLVVRAGEGGYTHVVLEAPRRAPETRMVAEPGDVIEVDTGARDRLRAGPGEVIVLERDGDAVRVLVLPGS